MSDHSDNYLRLRALQGIKILKKYNHPDANSYDNLTEDKIIVKAGSIIIEAKEILFKQVRTIVDELNEFGFMNKEIAKEIGFGGEIIARAYHCNDILGLRKLQVLVEKLQDYKGHHAIVKRIRQLVDGKRNQFIMLDASSYKTQTDEIRSEIGGIVFENFFHCLGDNLEKRLPLPEGFDAATIQVGSEKFGILIMQLEGTSDVERLSHQIHELEDLTRRKKNELSEKEAELDGKKNKKMKTTARRHDQFKKPRSPF
jgi:hypothetical protein